MTCLSEISGCGTATASWEGCALAGAVTWPRAMLARAAARLETENSMLRLVLSALAGQHRHLPAAGRATSAPPCSEQSRCGGRCRRR